MAISSYFIGDYSINGYQWVPVNCFNQLITLILYDADQPNLRGDFCQGLKEALYHLQAFLLGSQGKYYIHWQFLCSLSKGVHLQFFLDKLHLQFPVQQLLRLYPNMQLFGSAQHGRSIDFKMSMIIMNMNRRVTHMFSLLGCQ